MFPYFQLESLVHWVSITSIFPCLSNLNPTFTLHFYLKTQPTNHQIQGATSIHLHLLDSHEPSHHILDSLHGFAHQTSGCPQVATPKKVPCWRAVLQVPVLNQHFLHENCLEWIFFKETSRVNQKTNYISIFLSHVQAPEWVVSLKVPFARPRRDYKPPRKPTDLVSLVALVVPRVRPCPAWTVPFQFLASHPYPWWHIQVIHAPSPIHPKFLQRQRKYHHVAVCLGWEHARKAPVASKRSRGLPATNFLRLVRTKALRGWRVKQPWHEAYQTHQEEKKNVLCLRMVDGSASASYHFIASQKFRNKKNLVSNIFASSKGKTKGKTGNEDESRSRVRGACLVLLHG